MKANVENKKITGLNFDDGKKEFLINNDPNKVIRFNPTDVNLYDRILEAQDIIVNVFESLPTNARDEIESGKVETSEVVEIVNSAECKIKEAINYMLDSDCFDAIFGNTSPFSPVNGEFLINGVMEGLSELILSQSESENRKLENKLKKYRSKK